MKISAIIPAYNSGDFLMDALKSVRRQTRPVQEIIVVDDGSTDDTAEIVRAAGKDILYFRQENRGPSAARNLGIKRSSGDWVAFLDADDQWTPNKTAEQIHNIEKHPELCLVASDMAEIDTIGNTITASVLAKHHLLEQFQELDGRALPNALAALVRKNFIPTGTVLAHRETLLESGLFNQKIRFGEDLELWAKVASRCPITCLPRVHMLRRQHVNNATSNTLSMLEDLVQVARSIRESTAYSLKRQGICADEMVAQALWNLGYWFFSHGDFTNAKPVFRESFREYPTRRALTYRLASSLPPGLIRNLRHTKQMLSR